MFDDLVMTGRDPHRVLQSVLAFFPLDRLTKLQGAIDQGRLIKGKYFNQQGGCLMYFLGDILTKEQLLAHEFGDHEMLLTARRLVRHWDAGSISDTQLRDSLARAMAEKRELNALEDSAIEHAAARSRQSQAVEEVLV